MQKLNQNYNEETQRISEEFAEVDRKLKSLKEKLNEMVDWTEMHSESPEWHHQRLLEKVMIMIATEIRKHHPETINESIKRCTQEIKKIREE